MAAQLTGTWKLLSFTICTDKASGSKPIAEPYGKTPIGRIALSADGYLSCLLADPDNIKPIGSVWAQGSDEVIAKVARTMTTYCGKYTVSEEEGETRLKTQVDIALDPSWMGTEQVRKVELTKGDDGREVLTLKPTQYFELPNGMKTVGVFVWDRLE